MRDVYGKITNTCHTEEWEMYKSMKKLFISQPMKGKSDEDILAERKESNQERRREDWSQ